jgi:hypothetical protein
VSSREITRNADIKKIKLIRHNHAAFFRFGPCGKSESQKRIFQNIKIGAHRSLANTTLVSNVGVIQKFAGGQSRDTQKFRE